MSFIRLSLFTLCSLLLISCSYIQESTGTQGRDKNYMTAKNLPPLKIPPGISSDAFHNYYPVPYSAYPLVTKDVSIVPPTLADLEPSPPPKHA